MTTLAKLGFWLAVIYGLGQLAIGMLLDIQKTEIEQAFIQAFISAVIACIFGLIYSCRKVKAI